MASAAAISVAVHREYALEDAPAAAPTRLPRARDAGVRARGGPHEDQASKNAVAQSHHGWEHIRKLAAQKSHHHAHNAAASCKVCGQTLPFDPQHAAADAHNAGYCSRDSPSRIGYRALDPITISQQRTRRSVTDACGCVYYLSAPEVSAACCGVLQMLIGGVGKCYCSR